MTAALSEFVITPPPIASVPVLGQAARFPVRRIYCVGRNYAEHAKEMGFTGREAPFFFMKPADAILPVDNSELGLMPYPSATQNLHHEVELVIAIGRGGHHIATAQALDHVYGYAVGLDMTRRDLQNDMKKQGRPWCIGKGFEASAPIGCITPKHCINNIESAQIQLLVNEQPKQTSCIDQLIWSIPEIIEHISNAWTLQAGDLIFTGTPEGVGAVEVGDVMHAQINGLCDLKVQVV